MKNVLIVDDDRVSRLINKKIIQSLPDFNAITYEASNGQEALDIVSNIYSNEAVLPDWVLLDLNMDIMSGFEFIQQFQGLQFSNKEKMHIVIISSSDNLQDRQRAETLGIQNFITKPITPDKLKSKILQCL
jgi:two-component system, CitB family, response regulator MalR